MMKYIPITLTLSFALVAMVILFGTQKGDLSARLSKVDASQALHYETRFKELVMKDLEDSAIKLSELKAPVVILNFWASWCTPCLEEFPSLTELRKKYTSEQVAIIGINSDEDDQLKKIEKTKEKYKLNFQIVADQEGELLEKFMISAIPVTIVFINGEAKQVSLGKKDFMAEEFLQTVNAALK